MVVSTFSAMAGKDFGPAMERSSSFLSASCGTTAGSLGTPHASAEDGEIVYQASMLDISRCSSGAATVCTPNCGLLAPFGPLGRVTYHGSTATSLGSSYLQHAVSAAQTKFKSLASGSNSPALRSASTTAPMLGGSPHPLAEVEVPCGQKLGGSRGVRTSSDAAFCLASAADTAIPNLATLCSISTDPGLCSGCRRADERGGDGAKRIEELPATDDACALDTLEELLMPGRMSWGGGGGPGSGGGAAPAEICLVWPVVADAGDDACRLRLHLDDGAVGVDAHNGRGTDADAGVPGPFAGDGAFTGGDMPVSTLLVMAGCGMDVAAAVPVPRGAHCVELAREQVAAAAAAATQHARAQPSAGDAEACAESGDGCGAAGVLTLFNIGDGGRISPAVTVLSTPPDVAAELLGHFGDVAGALLALAGTKGLSRRDMHGFTVLPGTGCVASTRPHMDKTFHGGGGGGGRTEAPAHLDVRRPLSELSPDEASACASTWACHFQPLMRDVAFLLTCVPGAFDAGGVDGGSVDGSSVDRWDHVTYCKVLVSVVSYLEHHRCWHTLSLLLRGAGRIGLRLCVRGCAMHGSALAPDTLRAALGDASHDDVTVVYCRTAQQQQHGAASGSSCMRGPNGGGSSSVDHCKSGQMSGCGSFEDTLDMWAEEWLSLDDAASDLPGACMLAAGPSVRPLEQCTSSRSGGSSGSGRRRCVDRAVASLAAECDPMHWSQATQLLLLMLASILTLLVMYL